MKVDIINTNYIFNHTFFKVWKKLVLSYGIVLITLTMNSEFEELMKYEFLISILSKIFWVSAVIFIVLNQILFSRSGKIIITENKLIIEQKDSEQIINLNSVNEIILGKKDRRFYFLKILESDLVIEINKSEIIELKNILIEFNIIIKHRHFTDKVSEWLNQKIYGN